MSTKIWTAWRFRARHLNDFLDIMRPVMFARVIDDVRTLADAVNPEIVAEGMAKYEGRMALSRAATEMGVRVEAVLKMAGDAGFRESLLSLDCGFNVWIDRGRAYVIPWGHPKLSADIDLPAWAEDYHYQNSTDRPDSVTARQWDARARTWDRVALDDWDAHRLVYSVVSMDSQSLSRSRIALHFLRLTGRREDGQ